MPSTLTRRAARRLVAALALAACTTEGKEESAAPRQPGNPDPAQNTYAPALGVTLPAFAKTQEGVYYLDVAPGTGQVAMAPRRVTVHYTGWLPDGTKFDSSRDGNQPFTFTIGAGEVIRGWDVGVNGMRVGGRRTLVIPAELGYGADGSPPDIPPNSVLVFEVELVSMQ